MDKATKEAIKEDRLRWIRYCTDRANRYNESSEVLAQFRSVEDVHIANAILRAMEADQENE